MLLPPGKQFNFHLDFTNTDERDINTYRVSVTNIAKDGKTVASRHTVKFSPNTKWALLCIHLGDIVKQAFKIDSHQLNSIQLCGYAHYRGVYTSDV